MRTKENTRHWTEEEINYVKNHHQIISTTELSRKLGCSYQQVWSLMKKLELEPKKILKPSKKEKTRKNIRQWTEDEINYVIGHHRIIPMAELSRKVDCKYQQMRWLMEKLGLTPKKTFRHYSQREVELAIAGIGKKGEARFAAQETGRSVESIRCKRYQEKKKRNG